MTEDPKALSSTNSDASNPNGLALSLDNFKAIIYTYNAKPDTDIILFKGSKIIEIGDIRSLHELIMRKIENYEDFGNSISLNLVIGKNKIKEYSNWHEFSREDWNSINGIIKSLAITWIFYIKLPMHQLPQKHTVKIRIGSNIPPQDIFHVVMSSDNRSELLELQAEGSCKIDFINPVISTEILAHAESWYEGLKNAPKLALPFQKFLERYQSTILNIVGNGISILLLVMFLLCLKAPGTEPLFYLRLNIPNIQIIIVSTISLFVVGQIIGRPMAKWLDKKIDSYRHHSSFLITRGDYNAKADIENGNKSISKDIRVRFIWVLISTFISILARYLLSIK
ncbi:hypothetical protein [Fibrivirga algicola]|uniref:DUF2868 domain-containing protein n=1 Tax=Fibrivirga algicola TaxID=2950420 RepID=A0ABX0QLR8_9BACT|nr:hypothetical protein [Fibrivirga algicola]NID11553.1 hypothetical protein [Fibrivirga algicola]